MKDKNLNVVINLKRLMRHSRVNISEVARIAGIERVSLSRTLSNKTDPRDDTLAKLAAAFGVSVDYLEGDPEKNELPERIRRPSKPGVTHVGAIDFTPPEPTVESFLKEFEDQERFEIMEARREDINYSRAEGLKKAKSNAPLRALLDIWERLDYLGREIGVPNYEQKNGPSMSPDQEKLVGLISGLNDKQTARATRLITTMLSKPALDESEDGSGSL